MARRPARKPGRARQWGLVGAVVAAIAAGGLWFASRDGSGAEATSGTGEVQAIAAEDTSSAQAEVASLPAEDTPSAPEQRLYLINERDVQLALEEEYPPILRDAGIGGTVNVQFFIDEEGTVQRTLVAQTSGHPSLDEAALRVARVFKFAPALNLGRVVPVWIAIPITFSTR